MEINSVEDIYENVGGFGRFQFFAVFTILYPEFPGGMLEMLPIFTTNIPDAWNCSVNEIDTEDNGYFATCECTGNKSGSDVTLIDFQETSIVSEWGLVCEYGWVPDFITSVQMAGMLFGDFAGAHLNDSIGRKNSLYLYCLVMTVASLISAYVESIFLYGIAKFFVGAGISAYLMLASIYPIEFLTPKWRSLSRGIGPWGEGIFVLVLLAYFFRSWRVLTLVTSSTCLIFFVTYPLMLESPRWLMASQKPEKARRVFDKIADWNRKPRINKELMDNFLFKASQELSEEPEMSWRAFISKPQFMNKTLIFMSIWFSSCLIYYGIGFNVKNLYGDIYFNALLMAIVEMIGDRTASFVTKWFGRRKAFIAYMGICSVALLSIVLFEMEVDVLGSSEVINGLCMLAKSMTAGCITIIDVFTTESYPTEARSTAVGLANAAASLGSILSPQMALLCSVYRPLPYFVMGGFAVLCTIMTLFLKETNNRNLPD